MGYINYYACTACKFSISIITIPLAETTVQVHAPIIQQATMHMYVTNDFCNTYNVNNYFILDGICYLCQPSVYPASEFVSVLSKDLLNLEPLQIMLATSLFLKTHSVSCQLTDIGSHQLSNEQKRCISKQTRS